MYVRDACGGLGLNQVRTSFQKFGYWEPKPGGGRQHPLMQTRTSISDRHGRLAGCLQHCQAKPESQVAQNPTRTKIVRAPLTKYIKF